LKKEGGRGEEDFFFFFFHFFEKLIICFLYFSLKIKRQARLKTRLIGC